MDKVTSMGEEGKLKRTSQRGVRGDPGKKLPVYWAVTRCEVP